MGNARKIPLALLACLAMLVAVLPATSAGATEGSRSGVIAPSVTKPGDAWFSRCWVGNPPADCGAPRGRDYKYFTSPSGFFYSFPNTNYADKVQIHNRILNTIKSTWGGPRASSVNVWNPAKSGRISIATWSFEDWDMAYALVDAMKRGVQVRVVGAGDRNQGGAAWKWLIKNIGTPGNYNQWSRVIPCTGACRGQYGTAHAKYMLFNFVGKSRRQSVVLQTSANLTPMAMNGQWNHLVGMAQPAVYADYVKVFDQAIRNYWPDLAGNGLSTRTSDDNAYRAVQVTPQHQDIFFPIKYPGGGPKIDPFVSAFRGVYDANGTPHCVGSWGRTKIRVINYALYEQRGQDMANELRRLWNAGCDVAVIFSIASKPVRSTLLNPAGRGRIPTKQSAIKDSRGNFLKYNHSKWLYISGWWRDAYSPSGTAQPSAPARMTTISWIGSSNWSDLPTTSDEQIQRIEGPNSLPAVFTKTWNQGSSKTAGFGRPIPGGAFYGEPDEPTPGSGVYKLLDEK